MKIAVLLTCFNRKEKTLQCLEKLYSQKSIEKFELQVFLTDDNSKDGTGIAVKEKYPEVYVSYGNGNLFWAGGMRNSWRLALNTGVIFDYFLLLNDDTQIFEDTLEKLINSNQKMKLSNQISNITIGTTTDFTDGKFTYGGFKLYSKNRLKHILVNSVSQELDCDFGCANIMLVPYEITSKIGILNEEYIHGIADFDYTLQAKKAGFDVWVAPGVLGYCNYDQVRNWKSMDSKLSERIEFLYSPKGLQYKEYMFFLKTHFPREIPSMFIKFWVKTLFPFIYDKYKVERQEVKIDQES
ncbi:GT2 family glycosyltransferase [Algoriphagus ratkowskyi]|uniref:GT2 family glycosyltransferase n=1 Tax=Algoriphagus ratkowskyi TaxID=57028 RepID=A0A2W7QVR9_9BACT|nr:glycosyltransferase [Algoriphagus ratkowskyi]PZX51286.1 GT2 family glycosyltransferase [Algoriphagus ratkowskyi]TXD75924.1 glycosyltransferase family 2 protein [Algoriphagus ratkowskyi]